jgi:hypothetical protein
MGCSRANCFVPDTNCDLGHLNPAKCPAWTQRTAPVEGETEVGDDLLLPWSGSALGLSDLAFVSGRARPIVVGVAGAENAGKTTLLAAWYLLLGRGAAALQSQRFAGSYSLDGWEAVAGSLRWSFPGQVTFPAHTTSRSGRAPGLLHLAFSDHGRITDYLMTDAPGAWFQKWAMNRDAADAEGARWVGARADILVLVADREALSGEAMGAARSFLQFLATRMAVERAGRPVALVWTKSDVTIAPEMEASVRNAVFSVMPDAAEFATSIVSQGEDVDGVGAGLLDLLSWILSYRRPRAILAPPASQGDDPLFLFGRQSR